MLLAKKNNGVYEIRKIFLNIKMENVRKIHLRLLIHTNLLFDASIN
jgi:hypothetical protein